MKFRTPPEWPPPRTAGSRPRLATGRPGGGTARLGLLSTTTACPGGTCRALRGQDAPAPLDPAVLTGWVSSSHCCWASGSGQLTCRLDNRSRSARPADAYRHPSPLLADRHHDLPTRDRHPAGRDGDPAGRDGDGGGGSLATAAAPLVPQQPRTTAAAQAAPAPAPAPAAPAKTTSAETSECVIKGTSAAAARRSITCLAAAPTPRPRSISARANDGSARAGGSTRDGARRGTDVPCRAVSCGRRLVAELSSAATSPVTILQALSQAIAVGAANSSGAWIR